MFSQQSRRDPECIPWVGFPDGYPAVASVVFYNITPPLSSTAGTTGHRDKHARQAACYEPLPPPLTRVSSRRAREVYVLESCPWFISLRKSGLKLGGMKHPILLELGGIKHSNIHEIKHVTGFATFQVPRGYFVVFREICQENKTSPTMANNGGPFRKTASTLLESLLSSMPIRLHQDLQMPPPPSGPDGAKILTKSPLAAQSLTQPLLDGPCPMARSLGSLPWCPCSS